jgi:hypothetical protein
MSKNNNLWTEFQARYGKRFAKVHEYYEHRKSSVQLIDIAKFVPQFANGRSSEGMEEEE